MKKGNNFFRFGLRVYSWLKRLVYTQKEVANLVYWERRSRQYGARGVLNLKHEESDIAKVTAMQMQEIFPFLEKKLLPKDKQVLDLGCGSGRFSEALANLTNGATLAIDPISYWLKTASQSPRVTYKLMENNDIPAPDESIDLVWICQVLGGIKEGDLLLLKEEIDRVLIKGGLICLVENTTAIEDVKHWHYRTEAWYQALLPFCKLQLVNKYKDVDDEVSVLIGRKYVEEEYI